MNVFYAHINVTEPYCFGSGETFIQNIKTMLDAMQLNVIPSCPIQVPINSLFDLIFGIHCIF
jgi:hypothetical protein